MKNKNILVGGQAVIEGVMMRVPDYYATAVRRKNGDIDTKREKNESISDKFPILKKVILRGAVSLFESMKIGFSTLQWSADKAIEDEEDEDVNDDNPIWDTLITIFAFSLAILFFLVLPLFLTTKVFQFDKQAIPFNLIAGSLRITFFLLYLWLISRMEDVKKLFQYHGAEHKVVYTFEAGEDLTVENTKEYSTQHPRCGTSFMFVVLIISILLYSLIDTLIIAYFGNITLLVRISYHLLSIPLVAGISYEFLKIAGRNTDKFPVNILIKPGLLLQNITTNQPTDEQIETAIVALKTAFGDDYEKYKNKKYNAEAID